MAIVPKGTPGITGALGKPGHVRARHPHGFGLGNAAARLSSERWELFSAIEH